MDFEEIGRVRMWIATHAVKAVGIALIVGFAVGKFLF